MLTEVFKYADGFLTDAASLKIEERLVGKITDALFRMIVYAYIERFIIAINMRYKLKLELAKPLLAMVYADALLKKGDTSKQITKTALIDFYAKTVD